MRTTRCQMHRRRKPPSQVPERLRQAPPARPSLRHRQHEHAGGGARHLPAPAEALGLLYDATLCIGCKACVAACKRANDNPPEFSTADKLWDTPLDTSGYTFNIIKMYRSGTMTTKDDETNGYAFMKTSCMHCADPSCVSACPVTAMTKDPDDRHRRLRSRSLRRLPLLRRRLSLRYSQVPV
jgi:ferredoxin